MILWITSDHIAWHRAAGIAIDVGYGDAIQVITNRIRPHLSDLFSTVSSQSSGKRDAGDLPGLSEPDRDVRENHHVLGVGINLGLR